MTSVGESSMYLNTILRSLPSNELDAIRPHLEQRLLQPGATVKEAGLPPETIVFVETGILAMSLRRGPAFAFIGREGAAGVSALVETEEEPCHTEAALPSEVLALPVEWIRQAATVPVLIGRLHKEAHRRVLQAASAARAASSFSVIERVARLICLLDDAATGSRIRATHDTIASWLAVRRPGVTVASHVLEGERLIRARRGEIEVLDRPGLEKASGGAYGAEDRLPLDALS